MYRVSLTEEQRDDLRRRLRSHNLEPRTRERLEMVSLSDEAPRSAPSRREFSFPLPSPSKGP